MRCVLWKFIAVLVLAVAGLCSHHHQHQQQQLADSAALEVNSIRSGPEPQHRPSSASLRVSDNGIYYGTRDSAGVAAALNDDDGQLLRPVAVLRREHLLRGYDAVERPRSKRDTSDGESLLQWLTGRANPDRCVMVSVGGVIGGGALTGAFVGAGIGSIFTGPGTVVGALVGGVVGVFGGISVGSRAGAAACDNSANRGYRVQNNPFRSS